MSEQESTFLDSRKKSIWRPIWMGESPGRDLWMSWMFNNGIANKMKRIKIRKKSVNMQSEMGKRKTGDGKGWSRTEWSGRELGVWQVGKWGIRRTFQG